MRGFAAIGLVRPKDPKNIGGVMRACSAFGARLIVVEGVRGHTALRGISTDTSATWKHIPTLPSEDVFDLHPVGSIPIGVDIVDGATSLVDFVHPESAYYIFGPEDSTLGKKHLDRCAHVIHVPTAHCMNLAATVNVILYDRMAKRVQKSST